VQIHLGEEQGERLTLSIQDDGQGFVPQRDKGIGLLGMEERVVHLHGSFHVKSRPGEGTLISIELPLSDRHSKVEI
jgi:signal transduction histidine kinase